MARNRLEFPDEGETLDAPWFAPLHTFERAMPANAYSRFFDADDFMIMARIVRSSRPSIVLYKHRYTRRYLNLDADGQTYRFIPPRGDSEGDGRYVVETDVNRALQRVELWLLPWLKPDLALFRRGLGWEDRWRLHPALEDDEWLASNESAEGKDTDLPDGDGGVVTGGARIYCFKSRRRTS